MSYPINSPEGHEIIDGAFERLNDHMLAAQQVNERVAAVMKTIYDEIPDRLNVVGILRDAAARIQVEAAAITDLQARTTLVTDKVTEVLREIATHAVEQFTRRTGQEFLWKDEPEFVPDEENVVMTFGVNEHGHVVFGQDVPPPAPKAPPEVDPPLPFDPDAPPPYAPTIVDTLRTLWQQCESAFGWGLLEAEIALHNGGTRGYLDLLKKKVLDIAKEVRAR